MPAKKPVTDRLKDAQEARKSVHKDLADEIDRRKKLTGKERKASTKLIFALRKRYQGIRSRIKALVARKRAQKGRKKPRVVYTRISPNQSSRGGASPRIIVLHSTESDPRSLRAIADYFANPSVDASSHVVTDADGNSARCVPDSQKAWTQAYFNPVSLSIEQCGRAAQGSWPEVQVEEAARWIAKWSRSYSIPIQRGAVSGSSVTKAGVVTHAQLGAPGGGHHDPGQGFPVDRCLSLARKFR